MSNLWGLDVIITFLNYDIKNLIVMQKAHMNWTCGQRKCVFDLTGPVRESQTFHSNSNVVKRYANGPASQKLDQAY